jgi:predicted lipid-binding transport protein (Tim44 family)
MRRRATKAAVAVGTGALLLAPAASARGGGGSAGFRGGGGGFGGRGLGGFGHGHFLFFPGGGGGGFLLFALSIFIIYLLIRYLLPIAIKWWQGRETAGTGARRQVAERERKVELAAAEAAEDDPELAPDFVRAQGATLFKAIQAAWDAEDRERLRRMVAPELLTEWERRLDDFDRKGWRNRVQPIGEPKVDYVGLTHKGDEKTDHVVVLIEAKLRDLVVDNYGNRIHRVDTVSDTSTVREYWTMGKREGRWIVLSIEQGAEGKHELAEDIVATPWSDEKAMRDEALVEGAVADAVPEGTNIAELASLDYADDAHAAALDLSLADGRFATDVLEVAARRAVAAWVQAIDGDRAALEAIARPEAVRELLHPGDPSGQTRLVVRGLEVKRIHIAALDASGEPPAMIVEVELAGRRYIEDRDTTAVVAGSQTRATTFTERWTLALDGPETQPWRIAAVSTAVGHA